MEQCSLRCLFNLCIICVAILALSSCKDNKPAPQKSDGHPPGKVSEVTWTRLPGAVKISYTSPSDPDLFYVEANCETPSRKIESKATFYNNSLILEGFGDTSEYDTKIFAVDRGENKSAPVTIKIRPGLPPVIAVKNSIEVKEDFGGINVSFSNTTQASIVIFVLTPDSTGEWKEVDAEYTSRPDGSFSVRGFPAEKRKFGLYVRDKYDNLSDTLIQEVTPLFEEQLDKKKFREYRLDGDAPAGFGWVMPRLWDGDINEPNGFHTDHMGTAANPSGFPHHYTFDLGTVAKLSRFTFWQRGIIASTSFLYAHGNYRKFEIWGAVQPAQDGSWNGWTKLLDCESIKPSGLPIGQVSNEDRAYAAKGEGFVFPLDAPPVRYIRVNILSTWGGDDYSHCMEMTFWGATQ